MRETYTGSMHVSNLEYKTNQNKEGIDNYIRSALIHRLAASIIDTRIDVTRGDYSVVYRYEVIVATPDEYWKDVERKAMELQSRVAYSNFDHDQKREDS